MEINEVVVDIVLLLLPLVIALLAALIRYGISYLKTKTDALNNELGEQILNSALAEAELVAIDAIHATNQVFVDEIKKGRDDGKLTTEEVEKAINMAKDYFLSHISKDALAILEETIGPIEDWLEDFIEAKLGGEKSKVAGLANPLSSAGSE